MCTASENPDLIFILSLGWQKKHLDPKPAAKAGRVWSLGLIWLL